MAKDIHSIIEKIKEGIQRQERFMRQEDEQTEKGRKNIEFYKNKIAELEYRIQELEAKEKGNSNVLIPKYGDGKYASSYYKEAIDMLRVWYYKYFQQEPVFSPNPKWDMMFYDPTLWMPVNTYLVKGKIPFQLMLSANYPNHQSNDTQSVSIELPFEIIANEANEHYFKALLELIKIYAGKPANFAFGNRVSTKGMLSFIANKDMYSYREDDYYDFFDRLCDNNVRNIIYIGESMKKGVKVEYINKVQSEIIRDHQRLTARSGKMTIEELNEANEKIKKRIILLNNDL